MSMSNYGCSAEIVSTEFVKSICPHQFTVFEQMLSFASVSLDEFFTAQHFDCDYESVECEGDCDAIESAFDKVKTAFTEETDLILYTVFHNKEDRADELDGGAWAVDGVYRRSPAGERFKKDIETVSWTTFG